MVKSVHPRKAAGWRELVLLTLVAWLALVSVPLGLGSIGLGWDALNHHVYLGWIADQPRFDRDFLAASYQSFTYPYLYWPVYKLVQGNVSGVSAGMVLASLHLPVIPALWLLARVCIPEPGGFGVVMRWLSVVLAFLTGVVLSLLDSTANDLMAATPLVWAVALAALPWASWRPLWLSPSRAMLLSGLFAGMAVAFKLSNGPLAILMPILWLMHGPDWRTRATHAVLGSLATLAGFALFYGYWGWQLWHHYGNPVYPFYDSVFASFRAWSGYGP